jgi:hypothetical protein
LLELETISAATHGNGKWCIVARDMDKDVTGKVYIQGIVPAILNVANEDHAYADITDGEDYLTSCAFGPVRILDKESGTGEKWATVAIGIDPHEFDIVVSTATISAYAAMEIYGIAANGAYQVRKPTGDSLNQILVADGFDIPAATPTPIRRTWPKQVLLNGTAPAIGESIGSVNGQDYMQSGKTGFLHMGASGGRASVRPFNTSTFVTSFDDVSVIEDVELKYHDNPIAYGNWVELYTPFVSTHAAEWDGYTFTFTRSLLPAYMMLKVYAEYLGIGYGQSIIILDIEAKDSDGNVFSSEAGSQYYFKDSLTLRLNFPSFFMFFTSIPRGTIITHFRVKCSVTAQSNNTHITEIVLGDETDPKWKYNRLHITPTFVHVTGDMDWR